MTTSHKNTQPVQGLQPHQHILQENGPAAGRISGINHLVIFTRDMNEGVRFYRDLLGLRVVRTVRFNTSADGLRTAANHSAGGAVEERSTPSDVAVDFTVRQVFFEMGNGELFSLYEPPTVADRPAAPIGSVLWPASAARMWSRPSVPQKMDHLSFDVPTHDDVEWFRDHLAANGVTVSEISERRGKDNTHRFISSFYFCDPSGNPLEIATFQVADRAWESYDFSDWFMDVEPVEALLDDSAETGQPALTPHWLATEPE